MHLLSKYKVQILFVVLTFMCLFFLVSQWWVRAYLDAAYQFSMANNFSGFLNTLFNISAYNYVFSGDRTQLIAWRYIQIGIEIFLKTILGFKWGAIALYASYFCVNFFCSKNIITKITGKKYAYIWAFIYTFNPLSIYMLNEIWFLYVYSAVPILLSWFFMYFYEAGNKILWLLLCWLGTIFLTSYTRFMLIYILFLIVLVLFYHKEIWQLWTRKTMRCIVFVMGLFLLNLPFIFSVVYPLFSWEHKYFSGVSNYTKAFEWIWSYAYQAAKAEPFSKVLVPLEPTWNFWYSLRENTLFIYFSFLYFSAIIFFLLYKQVHMSAQEKIYLSVAIVSIFLWAFFRLLPHYFSENTFIYITYHLFPFLANNSAFSYRLVLTGLSMLTPLSMRYASDELGKLISLWSIVYCVSVASTLFFFQSNQKLRTVDVSKNNPIYAIYHGNRNASTIPLRWSILYPSNYLLFDWAPYPLPIGSIPWLLYAVESNERTTPAKQMSFWRYMTQLSGTEENIYNLAVLNISSFLVMDRIVNSIADVDFDFYNAGDYINQAATRSNAFSQNTGLKLGSNTALYKRFDTKNMEHFSFSLYLPKSIVFLSWYDQILQTGLDLESMPIIVDNDAYNRPEYMRSGYVINYHSGQTLSAKTSYINQFSFYVHLSHILPGQDVLLQLNKTFGVEWVVKHSDKNMYDAVSCNSDYYYPISKNTLCYINQTFPSLWNFLDALTSPSYKDSDHFQGNILGNTWIIKNAHPDKDGNLYILLTNDKQYLFIISEIIAMVVLCGLWITELFLFRYKQTVWRNL